MQRLVFDSLVEGLFNQALRKAMTIKCRRALAVAGIDLDRPLLPAYPNETWEECLRIAAQMLFGSEGSAAYNAMGELFIEGFQHTVLGSAIFGSAKLAGVRRSMQRTFKFRTTNNVTAVTAREVSPTSVEIRYLGIGAIPEFTQGCLGKIMTVLGARSPNVEIIEKDGIDCAFRASWVEP